MRAMRSHLLPFRVLPVFRFPALSLFPGHMPAQLASWPAVGKRLMSRPISAASTSAVRRWTPGMVVRRSTAAAKLRPDPHRALGDRLIEIVEMGEYASQEKQVV